MIEKYRPATWNGTPPNHGDNDPANAMMHAELAAILTVFHGPQVARQLTAAHENVYNWRRFGDITHAQLMDLYNNEVGIKIGEEILDAMDGSSALAGGIDGLYGWEWNPGFDPDRREGDLVIDVSGTGWEDPGDLVDIAQVQESISNEIETAYEESTLLWREEDKRGRGR